MTEEKLENEQLEEIIDSEEEIIEETIEEEELAADGAIPYSSVWDMIIKALKQAKKWNEVKDIILAVKKEAMKKAKTYKMPEKKGKYPYKGEKLSANGKDLYDEMYMELEKAVVQIKESEMKIQKLQEDLDNTEEQKEEIESEVKTKDEVIKIKEKQLESIEKRIAQIEAEKEAERQELFNSKVNDIADKYISSGFISEDEKESKVKELQSLSESALVELSGVMDRKLENISERVTDTSDEIQGNQETLTEQPPGAPVDKLSEYFDKIQKLNK